MSHLVLDSSIVAKWILPEADSDRARELIPDATAAGERLYVVDLALSETANAIWKRCHRGLITSAAARRLLTRLLRVPVELRSSMDLLESALEIAIDYDRSIYDALFVALAHDLQLPGVTADEPLWRAVHVNFPNISLLRDWS
ncbi:MAG: type II toxin-antitoxin system VapC family toxin [Thermoguttaceae bacterium]